MPEDKIILTGDANSLTAAINSAVKAWSTLVEAENQFLKLNNNVNNSIRKTLELRQQLSSTQGLTNGSSQLNNLQETLRVREALNAKTKANLAQRQDADRKIRASLEAQKTQLQAVGVASNKTFTRQNKNIQTATKNIQAMSFSFKGFVQLLGSQILRSVFFSLVQEIRETTDAAAELQIKISEVRSISQQAQLSSEDWAKGLKDLSDSFGLDILDQTEAAYQTLSNQVAQGAEAFLFLEQANRFSIAAVASAEDSVNLLTSALNSFNLDVQDTEKVSAIFFKTIELGRVRASELANDFGRVGVLANTLGVRLEDVSAAIATLTINGVKTNVAMTQIRAIFTKLIKPTTDMKKLFDEIGVSSAEAGFATFGFEGFLEILQERTQGTTTELAKLFSRVRSVSGAVGLTGKNLEGFQQNLREIEGASESFNKAVGIGFESAGKRLRVEINKIKNSLITDFGEPAIETIVTISEEVISLSSLVKGLGEVITFSLVPASLLLIKTVARFAVANPIIAGITVAVAALTFAIGKLNEQADETRKKQEQTAARLEQQIQDQIDKTNEASVALRTLASDAEAALNKIVAGTLGELNKEIVNIIENSDDASEAVSQAVDAVINTTKDGISDLEGEIKSIESSMEDLRDLSKSLSQTLDESLFDAGIEDLIPSEQITRIFSEIKRQIAITNEAAKTGNDALVEDSIKRAGELFKEARTLQTKLEKENEKRSKKRKDIIEDINETQQKGAFEIKRLEEERERILNGRSISRVSNQEEQKILEINREITDINGKRIKKVNELNKKLAENVELKKQDIDFSKRLTAIVEAQQKAIAATQVVLANQAEAKKVELAEQEKILKLQQRLKEQSADFKIDESSRLDTIKEINDAFDTQVGKLEELRSTLTAGSEEEIALSQRIAQIRAAQSAAVTRRQITDQQKVTSSANEQLQKQLKAQEAARAEQLKSVKEFINQAAVTVPEGSASNTIFGSLIRDIRAAIESGDFEKVSTLVKELNENLREDAQASQQGGRFREVGQGFRLAPKDLELARLLQRINTDAIIETEKRRSQIDKAIVENTKELTKFSEQLNEELRKNQDPIEKQSEDALTIAGAFEAAASAQNDLFDAVTKANTALETQRKLAAGDGTPTETKADGGSIHGSDSVPALLSPGEFVVNAGAARQFAPQLVAMNSSVGRFADGGSVPGNVSNTTFQGGINIDLGGNTQVSDAQVIDIGNRIQREVQRKRVRSFN